jgi:hypothetical protein
MHTVTHAVETSADVLEIAKANKTNPKLKKVAEKWGLNYIDIYKQWYPLGCSRDFLIELVKLSSLVSDYKQGQEILANCKKTRIERTKANAKNWLISDARQAVSEAKEQEFVHNSDSTPRPRRTASMAQNSQAIGSDSHKGTLAKGKRKRLPQESDSADNSGTRTSGQSGTSGHARGSSTEPASTTSAPAQQHSYAARALVASLETRAQKRHKENTAPTASTTPRRFPLTPSSAISADPGRCAVTLADYSRSQSSPSQPAQAVEQSYTAVSNMDQQTMEENPTRHYDAANSSNGDESAQATRQPFPRGDGQFEWTDEDRVDMVLQTYNPDPSIWYVVPTQIVQADGAVSAMLPEFRDAESSPKMVLLPLRGADGAQRTLILFDRMQAHCTVFDAGGCDQFAKMAWSTAQTLLSQMGILQGEASMDPHPLPSVHLNEGVSHGVLLVIAALHKLHDQPIDRLSPRLWRGLLAGFFPHGRDPPRKRLERILADFTNRTSSEAEEAIGIERNIEDAEALNAAKKTVRSYAEQARLLLEMTGSQLQSGEQRKKVAKVHEWLLAKPSDTEVIGSQLAPLEAKVVSQLGTLPDIPEWCEGQLRSIRTSCQYVVDQCEQQAPILEARCNTMVEIADAKHKLLDAKLVSLRT